MNTWVIVPIIIALILSAIYSAFRAVLHTKALEAQRKSAAAWPIRVTIPHGEVVLFRDGAVFVKEWGQWYLVFSAAPTLDVEVT